MDSIDGKFNFSFRQVMKGKQERRVMGKISERRNEVYRSRSNRGRRRREKAYRKTYNNMQGLLVSRGCQ